MTPLASSSWAVPPARQGRARMVRLVLRPGLHAVGGGDAPDGALRRAHHPGLPLNRAPSLPYSRQDRSASCAARWAGVGVAGGASRFVPAASLTAWPAMT